MKHQLKSYWATLFQPMLQRPKRVQLAALCHRSGPDGPEVLLVTSRDTGRWIIPKGWPIPGKDSAGAALQEAWEEGGVSDAVALTDPIGSYTYDKGLRGGNSVAVETFVYAAEVVALSDTYPEAHQRRRAWMSPEAAADCVDEPELKAILRAFGMAQRLS